MSEFGINSLRSFLPVDALVHQGKPQIEWLEMADVEFDDPFFHETVERWRQSNPKHKPTVSDYDALLQVEKLAKTCKPSGLIFHTSRCGSTLVANACRALNSSRVIAEAPVIDKLISRLLTDAPPSSPRELIYLTLIKAAVEILGRPAIGTSNRYVVKFAAPSILHIERIRRIWPGIPAVILYRHPLEVMASNLRKIPHWMIIENNPRAAAAILRASVAKLEEMGREEFCARALGRFYAAALAAQPDTSTFFLDYDELSPQMLGRITELFGFVLSREEVLRIESGMLSHSKDSRHLFEPDGLEKQQNASPKTVHMTEEWVMPAYLRLMERESKCNAASSVT